MSEHPIQGLMTTAMENIKDMVEVNTIIGDPVESPDGSIIIPVSKVGFGFAAGGSEFQTKSSGGDQSDSEMELPFGGGSGGGVSITPVAFLIVSKQGIKMVHLDENAHIFEKMINFAPQVVDKVQQLIKESKQGNKPKQQKDQSQQSRQRNQNQNDNQQQDGGDDQQQNSNQSDSNYSI